MHTTIKVYCLNGFEAVHTGRSRKEAIASFCNAYNVGLDADSISMIHSENDVIAAGMTIETYEGPLATVRFTENESGRISSRVMHASAVQDFFDAHGSDYIKLDVTPLATECNRTMRVNYVTSNGSSGSLNMPLETIPMWLASNPGTMIVRIDHNDLRLNHELQAARQQAELKNAKRLIADYEG